MPAPPGSWGKMMGAGAFLSRSAPGKVVMGAVLGRPGLVQERHRRVATGAVEEVGEARRVAGVQLGQLGAHACGFGGLASTIFGKTIPVGTHENTSVFPTKVPAWCRRHDGTALVGVIAGLGCRG